MKVALDRTIYTEGAIAGAAVAFADFADFVASPASDAGSVEIQVSEPGD